MATPSKPGTSVLTVLLTVFLLAACAEPSEMPASMDEAEPTVAGALITKSIAFHDPNGAWYSRAHRVDFAETRPGGPTRMSSLRFDPVEQSFGLRQERQGQIVEGYVDNDNCAATVDGATPDSTVTARWRLTCPDGLLWWRDYYAYVHGMPMKLVDDGGQVEPSVLDTTFMDQAVQRVKVTYDPEVGSDVWYFYFEPVSAELVGARFFHDEEARDGEYLIFDGEVDADGMRLIQAVNWYTNTGDRYLGTDSLMAYSAD